MRSVKKAINKYNLLIGDDEKTDIKLSEIQQVHSISENHWYSLIVNGMKAGFVWGYEYARKENKKEAERKDDTEEFKRLFLTAPEEVQKAVEAILKATEEAKQSDL